MHCWHANKADGPANGHAHQTFLYFLHRKQMKLRPYQTFFQRNAVEAVAKGFRKGTIATELCWLARTFCRHKKECWKKHTHTHTTHTHTRPEPGQPWKAKGRKKRTHTTGKRPRQRRGGKGTNGPPEPTYAAKRTWQKTEHTPKPNNTLRRSTRGKLGNKWGTSWWQAKKPKQVT